MSPTSPAPVGRVAKPRRRRSWLVVVVVVALVALCGGWLRSAEGRSWVTRWAKARGHHLFDHGTNFWTALVVHSPRWILPAAAEHVRIELKPKHRRRLEELRAHALAKGLIAEADQQKVPAIVHADGAVLDAEVRLKGDYTDHIAGPKWSLRVECQGDGTVFGMERFSLQDPMTKGCHGAVLFCTLLRQLDVLAPRQRFVTAEVAGRDFGVVAIEEHAAKELLESQGRRAGPIVRFDEAMVFFGRDDYREVSVVPFSGRRVDNDPVQRAQAAEAVDRLRAFADGVQSAAEVFAVDALAGYLAVVTFFGSWHAQRWHNQRFAFDPESRRLEPIGHDSNLQMRRPLPAVVTKEEPIVRRMLADPIVFAAYERRLQEICRGVLHGPLLRALTTAEREAIAVMHRELWLLEPMPVGELRARAEFFGSLSSAQLLPAGPSEAPALVRCGLTHVEGVAQLVVRSAVAEPVRLHAAHWVARDGSGRRTPFAIRTGPRLPVDLVGEDEVLWCGQSSPVPGLLVLELDIECRGRRQAWRVPGNPLPSARR